MLSVLDKLKKNKTTIEYHNVGIFPNSNRKVMDITLHDKVGQ
jgi:hypothetical protein